MRKHILIAAMLVAAACGKTEFSEQFGASDSASLGKADATSGNIEIKVTLPDEVKTVDVKASLTQNTAGNLDPAWEDGDQILVGNEVFTLVSAEGKTATFSGKAPSSETFDIVYPAAMADGSQVAVQAADGDLSHLKYHASLKGVNSYDNVHLSHGWAAQHGGTFSQMGCLKLVLNLPGTIEQIKSVKIYGDGYQTMQIGVAESGFTETDSTFTAYLPYDNIELDSERLFVIEVGVSDDLAYSNRFYPGSQTLHEGYVSQLVTSVDKWRYALKGYGTEQSPYLIASAGDLAAMHDYLSLNTYTCFRQVNDIDCSSLTSWIPVNNQNAAYGIMYDGCNFEIQNFSHTGTKWPSIFGVVHGEVKNLKVVNSSVYLTASDTAGLIAAWVGNTDNTLQGRLENVHVTNGKVSVTDNGYVGGIAGQSGSGTFINCSYNGIVERTTASTTGNNYPLGGILGNARKDVHLSNCRTTGSIDTKGRYITGGIIGQTAEDMTDLTDCHNGMTIYARMGYIGGIVAISAKKLTVTNCSNTGALTGDASDVGGIVAAAKGVTVIKGCYNTAAIKGKQHVGGILARNRDADALGVKCTISDCYNTGAITNTSTYTGGILAKAEGIPTITGCYNTGVIDGAGRYVGGVISYSTGVASISKCYNTGNVTNTYTHNSTAGNTGGIMGLAAAAVEISECYNTGNVTATGSNMAGGILTTGSAAVTISDCYSTGDISTKHSAGGIMGNAPKNTTISNCYSMGSVTTVNYSAAGILGRAVGAVASGNFSVDQIDNLIVENCISFNSSIKSTGGITLTSQYSIAPIVGFSSPKNTLRNCWRSPDVTVSGYKATTYNTLVDTEDADADHPLPYTYTGDLKWYGAYNGKVVAAGTTLSAVARQIGWSETIWNLSGDVPTLNCF